MRGKGHIRCRFAFACIRIKIGADKPRGLSGDQLAAVLKAALWCLTSPEKHFAEVIRTSILGLGTDEEMLTRGIVSRAEVDMEKVKEEYKVRYNTTVTADVRGDTSGYYMNTLLTLVGPEK